MMQCIIHVRAAPRSTRIKLTKVTARSWEKIKKCSEKWKHLDTQEGRLVRSLGDDFFTADQPRDDGYYHRHCYKIFTNMNYLRRKSVEVVPLMITDRLAQDADTTESELESDNDGANMNLASSLKVPEPDQCVVCGKSSKYVRAMHKMVADKLIRAQTRDGGLLRQAATHLQREDILQKLGDKDCVASEIKYHSSCYKVLTIQYRRKTISSSRVEEFSEKTNVSQQVDRAFGEFCVAVVDTYRNEKKPTTLQSLTRKFVNFAASRGCQVQNYKSWRLKSRLQQKYTDIRFEKSDNPSESQIVYFASETAQAYVSALFKHIGLPISSSSEIESTSAEPTPVKLGPQELRQRHDHDLLLNLYHACMVLRAELQDIPDTLGRIWPPKADDMSVATVEKMTPVLLYNALAWITGASDEPVMEQFASVDKLMHLRILSAVQDLIYLQSSGRKSTPKHYALGVALRHMTGSSRVIEILNKFGHCASRITVSRLETALAQLQADRKSIVPDGFKTGCHAIIPADNIDFSEETRSGAGTTHHTNSLIAQKVATESHSSRSEPRGRKRTHTLFAEPVEIYPYKRMKRMGPPPIPIQWSPSTSSASICTNVGIGRNSPESSQTDPQNVGQSSLDSGAESANESTSGSSTIIQEDASAQLLSDSEQESPSDSSQQISMNLVFRLMKTVDENNKLPTWTGFHTQLNRDVVLIEDKIAYLPMIPGSPTDMNTIYTILRRTAAIANELRVPSVVGVYDMAIYSKVQEVRWGAVVNNKERELYQKVVVRLGEFHTTMVMLGVLGTRFGSAGLVDLLIESGVVAEGSMNGVLSGKHYNRAVAAHKIVVEAMEYLRFQSFLETLSGEKKDKFISELQKLIIHFPSQMFDELVNSPVLSELKVEYSEYCDESARTSENFNFWSSYIDMTNMMLEFIKATRNSQWDDHLQSLKNWCPWFFAYDRVNYARYVPAYLKEMDELPITHPFTAAHLKAGSFTIQRQDKYAFSAVAADQALEQTMNRDTKVAGGLIGKTTNQNAVNKWVLSRPDCTAITRSCEELAGYRTEVQSRKDISMTRARSEAEKVDCVIELFTEMMVNPFTLDSQPLLHICSGFSAPEEAQRDLLAAHEKGEASFVEYMQKLSTSSEALHTKIPRQNLKTFDSKSNISRKDKRGTELSNRRLFTRSILLGKSLNIDLRELLMYPLGDVSYPLATTDGLLAKTKKSETLQLVEARWPAKQEEDRHFSVRPALILDAMAFIHSLPKSDIPDTWGELATLLLANILRHSSRYNPNRVDIVFDAYPDVSIKSPEHERRRFTSKNTSISSGGEIRPGLQIKKSKFKDILSDSKNKRNLVDFLFSQWAEYRGREVKELNITSTTKCLKILDGAIEEIPELQTNHHEADTRLILHARHAADAHNNVVIDSPDSDVAFIALASLDFFPENVTVRLSTGSGSRRRSINLSVLHEKMGSKIARSLLGYQVFTGVDSTSAFVGRGKKKGLDLYLKSNAYIDLFAELGSTFELSEEAMNTVQMFVCELYGMKSHSVDEARYKIFCTKSVDEHRLPPCLDSLQQHTLRAMYQSAIHRQAVERLMEIPSPNGYGWSATETSISIKWNTLGPAPAALLQHEACWCSKSKCHNNRCKCFQSGIACTDLCGCFECENISERIHPNDDEADSASDA